MLHPYSPLRQRRILWFFAWLLGAGPALAQPQLVKDVYGATSGCCYNAYNAAPTDLTVLNGVLYYAASDGENGRELWRSDGTAAGTRPVKDLWPGANSSNPAGIVRTGNTLYFAADGPAGIELWKSNGTNTGTVLVKDLVPGPGSSSPSNLTDVNGTLFFTTYDTNAWALWKSNGTDAGTVRLLTGQFRNLTHVNGTLYFTRTYPTGWELWKSNGTPEGTVRIHAQTVDPTYQADPDFTPSSLTAVNGTLFFSAPDDTAGRELWKSNGTAAGTVRVKDIHEGIYGFSYRDDNGEPQYIEYYNDSKPREMVNLNGTLYFMADADMESGTTGLWKSDGTAEGTVPVKSLRNIEKQRVMNGTLYLFSVKTYDSFELWKSNGTAAGTTLVKSYYGKPGEMLNANGTLYFTAATTMMDPGLPYSTGSWRLWKSNGTEAGTVRVATLYPDTFQPIQFRLTNVNGTVFFVNDNLNDGLELWKSNGTDAGTGMIKDAYPGTRSRSGDPRDLTDVNGTLFFTAESGTGRDLWKSNGTAEGTVKVKDVYDNNTYPGTSPIHNLVNLNGKLLFTSLSADLHYELWRSDGTAAGTVRLKDLGNVSAFEQRPPVKVINGTLYVPVHRSWTEHELWKSDGTAEGTTLVKTISTGQDDAGAYPQHLTDVNGTLYFVARSGADAWQLWKSNGTAAGTVPLKKIGTATDGVNYYGTFNANPGPLTGINGVLYFMGQDAAGAELWKSNGTPEGTVRVKDINAGSLGSSPASLVNLGGTLYFTAADPGGRELWKSDGTAAGTVRVKDINPGYEGSDPTDLTVFNGLLYLSAYEGTGGRELWRSNGTAAGTVRVKDIVPGKATAWVEGLVAIGNLLYFRADDGASSRELWRSDGTAAGTQPVQDLWAGNGSSYPTYFTGVGGTVFFAATTSAYARELWKYNPAACTTPNANLTVVPATACPDGTAGIVLKNAQAGVSYQLYGGGSPVGASVTGSGGDLSFPVPAASLSAGSNAFAVRAKGCVEVVLVQPATVTVIPSLPAPVAAGITIPSGQAATLAAGGGPADATYQWFGAPSGGTVLGTGSRFTTPVLTATTDYYVAAQVPGCASSARTKVTVTVGGAAAGTFRVNAGGNGFATIDARRFAADAYFSGGVVSTATTLGIAGTADDYLYQTGRHGASFAYNFPTGNGSYDVTLHFAETYFGTAATGGIGSRKFHVNLEGARKLTDYDIFARAGGALKATQETFRVNVADGMLNIAFLKGAADNPAVKAIEVLPAGSALAVNAGGSAFTTASGKPFASDVYYADGTVSSIASGDVLNTSDDALYRNARVGVFSYGLPSGNGTFDVTLHFAETYWGSRAAGGVGSRKFNVFVEGVRRLSDYDVFAKAGGAMRAVRETVRVTVSDGVLNLYFAKGTADNPLISALEVVPVTAAAREVAAGEGSAEDGPVRLFPNPVQDKLLVSLPFPAGQVAATSVTDAAGAVRLLNVHRAAGEYALEIGTAALPGGLYLLRLDTPSGRRVLKFVKQ
jgi:ELWxxDGT repeat protein